jgi:hypothetical protein
MRVRWPPWFLGISMGEEHVLTPHEAETVVDERIERFWSRCVASG